MAVNCYDCWFTTHLPTFALPKTPTYTSLDFSYNQHIVKSQVIIEKLVVKYMRLNYSITMH